MFSNLTRLRSQALQSDSQNMLQDFVFSLLKYRNEYKTVWIKTKSFQLKKKLKYFIRDEELMFTKT